MANGDDPMARIRAQADKALSDLNSGTTDTGTSTSTQDRTPSQDQQLQQPVFVERISRPSYVGKDLGDSRVTGSAPATHSLVKTDVYDAYDEWDRMSPDRQREFALMLERLGYIEPGKYDYADLRKYWNNGVDEVAQIYRASGRQVTPQGYYGLAESITGSQAADQSGPTKSTSTSTSVSFSTKGEARALITDAFRSELGRDPSRREVRAFYRALHAKQRKSPSTVTQTARASGPEGNRKTRQSSTSTGGVETGAFTQNYIDDRYDAEQDSRATATEYYDALLGLAGGGG